MSTESLFKFLLKLDGEMNRTSGEYRKETANKRTHPFSFDVNNLSKQTIYELESRKYTVSNEDRAVIDRAAVNMLEDLKTSMRQFSNISPYYKETSTSISMVFTSEVGLAANTRFASADDVFAKVKATYGPSLRKFFDILQEHLKGTKEVNPDTGREKNRGVRTKSGSQLQAPGRFFNAGHAEGEGVFESMLTDAFKGAVDEVVDDSGKSVGEAAVLRDLKALGVDLSIMREGKTDTHSITLESQSFNKKYGGMSAQKKKVLQQQLFKAIQKVSGNYAGFYDLEGSDTPRQKTRKKTIKSVIAPFKKIPGIQISVSDSLTIDESNSKATLNKKVTATKGKRISIAAPAVAVARSRVKKARPSTQMSPVHLMAILNQKLPETVLKNMGAPRLENQTGRFAQSARVTEVSQTARGFPSIGYTYQRQPYGVFESTSGSNFASLDRDPRPLIDSSIREIAAQLTIGRFYTRRV